MAAECAGAFIRWTVTATNSGESANAATGKPIRLRGVSNFRFDADGKITSELVFLDTAELARQPNAETLPMLRTSR